MPTIPHLQGQNPVQPGCAERKSFVSHLRLLCAKLLPFNVCLPTDPHIQGQSRAARMRQMVLVSFGKECGLEDVRMWFGDLSFGKDCGLETRRCGLET